MGLSTLIVTLLIVFMLHWVCLHWKQPQKELTFFSVIQHRKVSKQKGCKSYYFKSWKKGGKIRPFLYIYLHTQVMCIYEVLFFIPVKYLSTLFSLKKTKTLKKQNSSYQRWRSMFLIVVYLFVCQQTCIPYKKHTDINNVFYMMYLY